METTIKYHAMPCPVCGSTNIGVKDTIVITPWRVEARKTWCYCKGCNHKGPEALCLKEATHEEETNCAYKAWNKEKVLNSKKLQETGV